jgi:hypothetical protein
MIEVASEARQTLLDQAAIGRLHRRVFHSAVDLAGALDPGHVEQALAAADVWRG